MTEQAADGTAARDESVESVAFEPGSLGRLAPTWWEPEDDDDPNPSRGSRRRGGVRPVP